MKSLVILLHDQPTTQKYKSSFISSVKRYGGSIRWNLDDTVNTIVIEKKALQSIFNKFIKWREAVLSAQINEYREQMAPDKVRKTVTAKSKRQLMLLREPLRDISSN